MAWKAPANEDGVRLLADPVKLARKVKATADDPDVLDALERASDRFRGAVGHSVHDVFGDGVTLNGPGPGPLQLPGAPVIGAITIAVRSDNGPTSTVTFDEDSVPAGWEVDWNSGIVRRDGGFPSRLGAIRVTFNHGYVDIPGDVSDAVLEMAEIEYNVEHGFAQYATGNESVSTSVTEATGVTARWTQAVDSHSLDHGGGA